MTTTTYLAQHFPLSRACLCVDCETCFEVGETKCPGCSGGTFVLLSSWLDRERSVEATDREATTHGQ